MQHMIAGCESCSEDEELPIENILDRLTGSDPSVMDYVLEVPAKCFQYGAEIAEKTGGSERELTGRISLGLLSVNG